MEDVLRVLVIVGLAAWAGWGFLVGLRAEEGQLTELASPTAATYGPDDDEGEPL